MHALLRIIAIACLLIPFLTGGCLESEFQVVPPQGESSDDEGLRAETDETMAPLSEVDWFASSDMDSASESQPRDSGFAEFDEEQLERQSLAIDDIGADIHLDVDGDAPDLEIRQLQRREGSESYFLEVTCHDEEERLSWRRINGSRISERCEVELATAVRAISIEPRVSFRVAPTPRGFHVLGDFERGEYEVRIAAGLRTKKGSVLKEEYEATMEIAALSKALAFSAEGRYLPRSAWDELQFRHRNVEDVKLEVRHIPHQNLPFWISSGSENVDRRTSTQVVDTEIAVRNEDDQFLTSAVSVAQYLGQPDPGLYQLKLNSGGAEATSRLQVTDINLIAKRNEAHPDRKWEDHIDVWAVHMETTRPLRGVIVRAIKPSGATFGRCRTDLRGHCRIALSDDETDPTPPMAIVAERGDDLTYLKFDELRTEAEVEYVDGPNYRDDFTYLATLYGDRDLYRPGDTFHLVGALRDGDYTSAGADIPAEIVIRDPQGKVAREQTLRTDAAGLVDLSFPISEVAPTGRWTAKLEVGKRELETYSFHVEEFVPERLEVSARATEPVFVGGELPTFEVEARYLFGASAAGSSVEIDCRLVPVESRAGVGTDFRFGPAPVAEERSIVDLPSRNGVVGDDDSVEISCPSPETGIDGPMRVEATVAVAEGGSGRMTRASASARVYPAPVELGLKASVDDLAQGDTFVVEGVVVDLDGSRAEADGTATIEFYNVQRHRSWQYDRSTRRYRVEYNYEVTLERVGDVAVEKGRFAVETTAADVAHAYLVRATYDGAVTDLQIDRRGRHWSWSRNRDRTPRPRRPGRIEIEAPDEIPIGKEATIDFDAPFAGRALLTVETDRIVDHQWVDAEEGINQWSFTVDGSEPNVYVSAMIVADPRAQTPQAFAPERAFGALSVDVESSPIRADVQLDVPAEVRPGDTLQIEVDVGDLRGAKRATVAAVDEGILQLTNYATPDPVAAYWRARSAGVETYDTIGWATQLPPSATTSRTGGGGHHEEEHAGEGRIMPFRPVAMWSGPVEIGSDGRAYVEFEVPNYRGRLRVMTSVFGEQKVGSADRDVLVRDPITVQTTFPRGLTVDDEVRLPVFVANLTDESRTVAVTIDAEAYDLPGFDVAPANDDAPVLEFLDGMTRRADLDAGASATVYFLARAARPGGAASVVVEAASGEHHTVDEGTIPFRPKGPRERVVERIDLEKDGTVELASLLEGWVPSSEETLFFASAFPEPRAFDNLDYLVRYPYGCAEQTVSSTRPMVFLSELVGGLDPGLTASSSGLRHKVEAGISRILSMQEASGGFRFWPSPQARAYPWVTAYALHFLIDVKNQGYDVPQERIDSATNWLKNAVNNGNRARGYEHYVLALAGEPQTSQIRQAIAGLPIERRARQKENAYLLKAALYLAGDRSYADELREPDFDRGWERSSYWGFYSARRARAMMLNVFVELFGQDDSGQALVRAVTGDLTRHDGRRRWTTQEIVWGVTGLGRWYGESGMDEVDMSLLVDGRDVAGGHYASTHRSWSVMRASEFDEVALKVERGDHDGGLSLMVSSTGVREKPTAEYGGQGLKVGRTFLDASGNRISTEDIELGDVVYVRLRVRNTSGRSLRQLAMVDRLPAGLEVENPDLGAAELPAWAQATWETDHINTRDDRVELFGTIGGGGTVDFVYAARATLSGTFHAPSLEIEGMYEPEIWARARGSKVRVIDGRADLVD